MTDLIGYIGSVCFIICLIPQILKIFKEGGSTRDISLGMYGLMILGCTMMVWYSILTQAWPVFCSNAASLFLASIILVKKISDLRKEKNSTRRASNRS